jgi:hypothetical protein
MEPFWVRFSPAKFSGGIFSTEQFAPLGAPFQSMVAPAQRSKARLFQRSSTSLRSRSVPERGAQADLSFLQRGAFSDEETGNFWHRQGSTDMQSTAGNRFLLRRCSTGMQSTS